MGHDPPVESAEQTTNCLIGTRPSPQCRGLLSAAPLALATAKHASSNGGFSRPNNMARIDGHVIRCAGAEEWCVTDGAFSAPDAVISNRAVPTEAPNTSAEGRSMVYGEPHLVPSTRQLTVGDEVAD